MISSDTFACVQFQKTVILKKTSPQLAFFSSRGLIVPNNREEFICRNALLTACVSFFPELCYSPPHSVGIVALIQSNCREWSLAAIRSAIVNTVHRSNNAYGVCTQTWLMRPWTLDLYVAEIQDYINSSVA